MKGELGYHLTHLLTGHGDFDVYLQRFHLREDSGCVYCVEENTFFLCNRWAQLRHELGLDELTLDTVVEYMH